MIKQVKQILVGVVSMVLVFGVMSSPVYADDLAVTSSNAFAGAVGVAIPIDDIVITGTTPDPTPVKLLVTSGTLAFGSTTGLSFTGGTSGSTLYFSGSIANINAALATLTYTRGSAGSDTLEVSLVEPGEVFLEDNEHLYEYISDAGDWNAAKIKAEALTRYGAQGYLATITSAEENAFVAARLANAGWMGASDAGVEGTWNWVTGPELGTTFWSGDENGSAVSARYENWSTGEPNDSSSNEDCAQFLSGGSGQWNDLPCSGTSLPGYVVEFGAPGDLPVVAAKNITIETYVPPEIVTLSPADNAVEVARDANLVMTFDKASGAAAGTITIYDASDDSVHEVIDVATGQISGNGTTTLTINPVDTLRGSKTYYILISETAIRANDGAYFGGISSDTTWNFTTVPGGASFVPPPSCIAQATSRQVVRGSSSVITVSTTGEGIYYLVDQRTGQTYSGEARITVNPAQSTTYSFAAVNAWGSNLCEVEIMVTEPVIQDVTTSPETESSVVVKEEVTPVQDGSVATVWKAPACFSPVWTGGLVKRGVRGQTPRCVQELVNSLPLPFDVLVDGIIGTESDKGIRQAQSFLGVPVDGLWGKVTHGGYALWVQGMKGGN